METIYDADITSRIEAELKQLDVQPVFCENALKILEKRYLMKDDDGEVMETPKDMLIRVAANIAYADMFYGASYDQIRDFAETIYTTMANLELLPVLYCVAVFPVKPRAMVYFSSSNISQLNRADYIVFITVSFKDVLDF